MKYQSIRGMQDLGPSSTTRLQKLEKTLFETASSFGFLEVRFPLLEQTPLFTRSTGEFTDIVGKEMYSFIDRSGVDVSLRPEGTAGCVRAFIDNGWKQSVETSRLFYLGAMFRYENPQKGRFRQFSQFGVESFLNAGIDSDLEMLWLSMALFEACGVLPRLTLRLNFLASLKTRQCYLKSLKEFLEPRFDELDENSKIRLKTNPLRILDSKDINTINLLKQAPKLCSFYTEQEKILWDNLMLSCRSLNCTYEVDPFLVRGLDYYTGLVFEWVTTEDKAQNAVCAGGRYDELVETLGGSATPAVGFAIGVERLMDLIEDVNPSFFQTETQPSFYMVWQSEEALLKCLNLATQIRSKDPSLKVVVNKGVTTIKKQLSRASESGAKWCVIVGEREALENKVTVKNLKMREQETMSDALFEKWCNTFYPPVQLDG